MRDIAALAGVSAMTVSKALRNSPKVAPRTRAKILRIAGSVGYRPDPEVTKLMNHLRSRSKPVFQGLICAITDRPIEMNHPYIEAMVEGARRRAETRGYGFSFIHFEEDVDHRRLLRRVLWARGAQGVLFLPLREPFDVNDLLDWKSLSVVAATSSIRAPVMHRVIPNHYANTLKLCEKLALLGYRRVGLAIDAIQDVRVNHAFSAAVTWHNYQAQGIVIPPMIFTKPDPQGLKAWYKREKPDALITSDHISSQQFASILDVKIGGAMAFVCTSTQPTSGISGIDEIPTEIAAIAVDRLAGLIQNSEKGIPKHATSTLLEGHWTEGISCRPKPGPGRSRSGRG